MSINSGLVISQNSKIDPIDLFSRIDSLENIGLYDEACNLVNEFIDSNSNSDNSEKLALSKAYLKSALCIRYTGQNHEAIKLLNIALDYALFVNDSIEIANIYRELGYTNTVTGNYDEGLKYYSSALIIDELFEDLEQVSIDLNAIGKIHEMWRQFDKALDFFERSLVIAYQLNNLNQIAVRQASIASVYKSQTKFEEALDYLNKALAIEIELKNEVRKGYRLDQIGEIYTLMNEYDRAEESLLEALDIFKKNKIIVSECIVLNHLGLNYLMQNDYPNAIKNYNASLEIAKKIGFNNMMQKNNEELTLLHEKTGNFSKALEHYRQFVALKDSAYNENARKQLLDFQVKYETAEKEKELAILNQEKLEKDLLLNQANQQRIIMIGISLILLISLGALYSRFLIKKRTQRQLTVINVQLNELNQTKDKFFTILAHDLKNPIYAFRNISSAVHDNFNDLNREEIDYFTKELKYSSNKLCSFLDELLKWAASQTGRIIPQLENVQLNPLIEELINLHQSMIDNKKISLIMDVNETHRVFVDRNMMHTVFRNIISNAIKFTPDNGWVKVESIMDTNELYMKISDSGIGMTEDDVKMLFDIGSDTSKIGKSDEKGAGLGLILCKEFVERNNGNIMVESSLGKGSTFIISLPVNTN